MKQPDLSNLSLYYSDVFIIDKTVLQIRKDLGLEEKELIIEQSGKSLFENLTGQVKKVIDDLVSKSLEQFFQRMYRIDLSQSQLEQCKVNRQYDTKLVAEMIVKRCLQKVVIREWYKNKA